MRISIPFALAAALLLSGCYVSKAPLITPQTADYPIADGTHFDMFAPAGKDWRRREGRTLMRRGEFYVYRRDGSERRSPPLLFKRVAKNLYIVQVNDRDTSEFYYELIRFDGRTAIQYQGTCNPKPDWTARGLIDRVEQTAAPKCYVSNLNSLATMLQEAAKYEGIEARYVVSPPGGHPATP